MNQKSNQEKQEVLLSVVVIGLNEEKRIEHCLTSIQEATRDLKNTEIVYVDSGSTDNTIKIALSQGIQVFQLGQIQLPSPAAGRFVGTLETHGKYILFVDGDTRISSGWILNALKMMKSDSFIAMINGMFIAEDNQRTSLPQLETIEPLSQINTKKGELISGLCTLYNRKILEKAGNWNPFVRSQEEADLVTRIRYFIPKAKFIKSKQIFAVSPRNNYINPKEFVRRWKRGFMRGAGQILKTSLKQGYWKACWPFARRIIYSLLFMLGLIGTLIYGYALFFITAFLVLVFLRALWLKNIKIFPLIFYSLILGLSGFCEFLTVSAKDSNDYIRDYREVKNT